MPRHNRLRYPSYRNLQIYHRFAYERRTQTALAKELGLSQRRVSQIAQQVQAWVDLQVPPRHYLGQDGLRFHLAIAHERLRLKESYEPLVAMFTGPDGDPRYLRRYITVVNGQPLHTVEVSEKPDFRLLNQATTVVGRMAQLEAIANSGPFPDLPNQIDQTITHRYEPAANETTSGNPSNPSTQIPPNTTGAPSNAVISTTKNTSSATEIWPGGVLRETVAAP